VANRNLLSPEEWAALKQALQDADLPSGFARVKPLIAQNLSIGSYYVMNLLHHISGRSSFDLSKSPLASDLFFDLLHFRSLILLICLLIWDWAYFRFPRMFQLFSACMLVLDGLSLGLDFETFLLFLIPSAYPRVSLLIILRCIAMFYVLREVIQDIKGASEIERSRS
jgi:hypothetical protein